MIRQLQEVYHQTETTIKLLRTPYDLGTTLHWHQINSLFYLIQSLRKPDECFGQFSIGSVLYYYVEVLHHGKQYLPVKGVLLYVYVTQDLEACLCCIPHQYMCRYI
jgi:hypothetical protein